MRRLVLLLALASCERPAPTPDAGPGSITIAPRASNYTMLAQECGHHIIRAQARKGDTEGRLVRDYARCDAAFDGCFMGCGAALAKEYPWPAGTDEDQARWLEAAVACADQCDRLPRGDQ